jgi:hypothetical protein
MRCRVSSLEHFEGFFDAVVEQDCV